MADSVFRREQQEISSNSTTGKGSIPDQLPFWAEFSPVRVASIILRRAGIDPLEVVRVSEDLASIDPVTSDVTVTYSAEAPK